MSGPPGGWRGLDLAAAPTDAPAAFCADLSAEGLLDAYRHGLFPLPAPDEYARCLNEALYEDQVAAGRITLLGEAEAAYRVAWWSPDPRLVIGVGRARLPRRLARRLRNRDDWSTSLDQAFPEVLAGCADGRDRHWLTGELRTALARLHERGAAHSAEVWADGELIGGAFGVRVGPVLSLDSMFHRRPDASRVAIADLAARFAEAGGHLLDVQWDSPHIRTLGAVPIPRPQYLATLRGPAAGRPPVGGRPARALALDAPRPTGGSNPFS
ncbi:leucyl/phenylalanyl-tRNA--protein transferase [Kitasatospora sp. NBC_01266]|uniref:leucyl/phenylalanyl-tRNA--protein transferase n=1 Tax=Kitasatospora sp. NBC_01266 TaxID=2903572 RepID=UPI002E3648E1|nr:leucyl/phenylalanyl-tRNA--protein transferase [Kitasatospora sp. NBC_01266]